MTTVRTNFVDSRTFRILFRNLPGMFKEQFIENCIFKKKVKSYFIKISKLFIQLDIY